MQKARDLGCPSQRPLPSPAGPENLTQGVCCPVLILQETDLEFWGVHCSPLTLSGDIGGLVGDHVQRHCERAKTATSPGPSVGMTSLANSLERRIKARTDWRPANTCFSSGSQGGRLLSR